MIQLHVTIYEPEDGQTRFKCLAPDNNGDLKDVTDQYTVAAAYEESEQTNGFMVMKKTKREERKCRLAYHPQPCDCGGP